MDLGEVVLEVQGLRVQDLLAGEREQLPGQVRGPFARVPDVLDRRAPRIVRKGASQQHLAVAVHDREDVVEVVRDATGQPSDGLHLLRVPELRFGLADAFLQPCARVLQLLHQPDAPQRAAELLLHGLVDPAGLRALLEDHVPEVVLVGVERGDQRAERHVALERVRREVDGGERGVRRGLEFGVLVPDERARRAWRVVRHDVAAGDGEAGEFLGESGRQLVHVP